jgi:hypothetical protein
VALRVGLRDFTIRLLSGVKLSLRGHCQTSADDPGCVKTLKAVVDAQQKNRICGVGESFMR